MLELIYVELPFQISEIDFFKIWLLVINQLVSKLMAF